jgi:hypothetical protein
MKATARASNQDHSEGYLIDESDVVLPSLADGIDLKDTVMPKSFEESFLAHIAHIQTGVAQKKSCKSC